MCSDKLKRISSVYSINKIVNFKFYLENRGAECCVYGAKCMYVFSVESNIVQITGPVPHHMSSDVRLITDYAAEQTVYLVAPFTTGCS